MALGDTPLFTGYPDLKLSDLLDKLKRVGVGAAESSAIQAKGLLPYIPGLNLPGGSIFQTIAGKALDKGVEALPDLPPAETFGEKAADFLGYVAPDLLIGAATAPIAASTKASALAKGAGRIPAILKGEAAQSAAILPFDLAREDRSTGESLAAAGLGTAFGGAINALLGRKGAIAGRKILDEVPDFEAADVKQVFSRLFNQGEAITPQPFTPQNVADLVQPKPKTALRDLPPPKTLFAKQDPDRLTKIEAIKDPKKKMELLQNEILAQAATEQAGREIIDYVGDSSPAAKWIQDTLANRPLLVRSTKTKGSRASLLPEWEGSPALLTISPDAPKDQLVRIARHELGHFLVDAVRKEVPERTAQLAAERQATHYVHLLNLLDRTSNVKAAKQAVSKLSEVFSEGGYESLLTRQGGKATGEATETTLRQSIGARDPYRDIAQRLEKGGIKKAREYAAARMNEWFDLAEAGRIAADARGPSPADEFLKATWDIQRTHPFRNPAMFNPQAQGAKKTVLGRDYESIQWGWEEGMADVVELLGRGFRKRLPASPHTQEQIAKLLGREVETEQRMIADAIDGDDTTLRHLYMTGRGGALVDALDPDPLGGRIGGATGEAVARTRMFLPSSAPAIDADGKIIRAGDPATRQNAKDIAAQFAYTQQEYVDRLLKGFEGIGGLTRETIERMKSDKPFRHFRFTEQFQMDTIARKALRAKGLDKKAQDIALEGMSRAERAKLARETSKFVRPPGALEQQLDEALSTKYGPQAQAMFAALAKEGSAQEVEDAAKLVIKVPKNKWDLGQLYDRLIFLYKGNLLMHYATLAGNITSTQGFGALVPARSVAAAGIDALRASLPGAAPRTRFVSDAATQMHSWMAANLESVPALRQDRFPKEFRVLGPKLREVEEGLSQLNPWGKSVVGRPAEFVFNTLNASDKWMFNNAFVADIRTRATRQAIADKAADVPKRAEEIMANWAETMRTMHADAVTQVEKQASESFDAAIKAGKEAIEPSGEMIQKDADRLFKTMVQARPELAEVMASKDFADRLIFTAREGRRMDNLMDGIQDNTTLKRILEPFIPFRRTIANIMRETIRTSPIGAITAAAKFSERLAQRQSFVKALEDGAAEEIPELLMQFDRRSLGLLMDDLGQAAVGTGIALGALGLVASGQIRYLPYDPKMNRQERLLREQAGEGTDAVIIGDFSIPANRLPPPLGALIRSAQQVLDLSNDDPNKANLSAAWVTGFVGNLVDDTFLQGLEGMVGVFKDPLGGGIQFAGQLGGSVVPRFIQSGKVADIRPERSGPAGIAEAFIRGALGRVGVGEQQVGPLGTRRERTDLLRTGIRHGSNDPIAQELVAADYFPSLDLPRGLDLSIAQQNAAQQAKGQLQRQIISRLVQIPQWQDLSPERKKAVLQKAVRKINTRANAVIKARAQSGVDITYQSLLEALGVS